MTDKPPKPMVRKVGGKLSPITAFDAEELAAFPDGMLFDLVARNKRSNSHNGMYWAQLSLMVKATEAWPTREKMHEWVKLRLGYTSPIFDHRKVIVGMTIDSTDFNAMDQSAFNVFYEKAAALIAAEMGIDLSDVVPGWSI